jgi:hypothetical protein
MKKNRYLENNRVGEKETQRRERKGRREKTSKWRRTEEVIVYKCKKPKLFRAGCSPQPLTKTAVILRCGLLADGDLPLAMSEA